MSAILNKLNVDHYMGNDPFEAIQEWETEHGEMGVYKSDATPFLRENYYLMILANGLFTYRTYDRRAVSACMFDAETIAVFAGAIKKE